MTVDRRSFVKNLLGVGAASAVAAVGVGAFQGQADASPSDAPIRPPGALPEDEFLSTCIRCMRCVDACPNQAIKPSPATAGRQEAGTPYIKPREQTCMLCSRIETDYLRCGEACPSGALKPVKKTIGAIRKNVKMGVARLDFNLCYTYPREDGTFYTCGTCYHACPLAGEALKLGLWERPSINEEACIGCGLCERACIRYPQAIRVEPVNRSVKKKTEDGVGQ